MASSDGSTTASITVSCSAITSGLVSAGDCDALAGFDAVLAPLLLGVIVVGIIANVVVLFVIATYNEMHSFANLFVANLCLTHIVHLCVIGVTNFVHYIEVAIGVGTISEGVLPTSLHLYIFLVITNSTCAMLTALTIERYLTIVVDLKRAARFQTIRVAVVFCLLVWAISIIVSALVFHGDYSDSVNVYVDQQYRTVIIISFVYSYVIPLIIIGIIYRCIGHEVRRQEIKRKHDKKKTAKSSPSPTKDEDRHDHEVRTLKTVCSVVTVFAVNFGCFYIVSIFLFVLPLAQLMVTIISQVSHTVAILTASAHPIIYCLMHPSFQPHVRRLIFPKNAMCVRCRRGARCLSCCSCFHGENDDDGDRGGRPCGKSACSSFRPDPSTCYACCPCFRRGGGRPPSIRMMMRKVSTLGGTVNASDEFVLVNRERVEAEKARKVGCQAQHLHQQPNQRQDKPEQQRQQDQYQQTEEQQDTQEPEEEREQEEVKERQQLEEQLQKQQKQHDQKQHEEQEQEQKREQHEEQGRQLHNKQAQDQHTQEENLEEDDGEEQEHDNPLYHFPLATFPETDV